MTESGMSFLYEARKLLSSCLVFSKSEVQHLQKKLLTKKTVYIVSSSTVTVAVDIMPFLIVFEEFSGKLRSEIA